MGSIRKFISDFSAKEMPRLTNIVFQEKPLQSHNIKVVWSRFDNCSIITRPFYCTSSSLKELGGNVSV